MCILRVPSKGAGTLGVLGDHYERSKTCRVRTE